MKISYFPAGSILCLPETKLQYDLTACYILKNTISEFGNEVKEFESIGQTLSSVQDWSLEKSFRGTFDGNGNGIYGFTILPNGAYCGLFTSIGKEGVVKNLNMSASMNPSESTDCTLVGGIAGYNEGTISNCIVKVTSKTPTFVTAAGSIVAVNAGQIQDCQGEGEITTNNNQNTEVGGIAGINREGGTFDHCITLTKFTNSPGIRKLIGRNEAGNNTGDFRGYSVKQFDNSMYDAQGACAMRITYDQIVMKGAEARINNLKEMNALFNYLMENGIHVLDALESQVNTLRESSDSLKTKLDSQTARMKEIRKLPDYLATYHEMKPVYDGLQKTKFSRSKERYKADHAAELKQFYEARRKLSTEFPDGKFDHHKLDTEYARLEQEHEDTYAQFKSIRADSQQLWKIKSCLDSARKNLEQSQQHASRKQEQEI